MVVLPVAFVVLLVDTFVLDTPSVVVVILEIAFIPVTVRMDVLSVGVLLPILPESYLKVIF